MPEAMRLVRGSAGIGITPRTREATARLIDNPDNLGNLQRTTSQTCISNRKVGAHARVDCFAFLGFGLSSIASGGWSKAYLC